MTESTQQLLTEALRLSEQERGLLAAKLLESLGFAVDDDAESAWNAEIRHRLDELDMGMVQTVP